MFSSRGSGKPLSPGSNAGQISGRYFGPDRHLPQRNTNIIIPKSTSIDNFILPSPSSSSVNNISRSVLRNQHNLPQALISPGSNSVPNISTNANISSPSHSEHDKTITNTKSPSSSNTTNTSPPTNNDGTPVRLQHRNPHTGLIPSPTSSTNTNNFLRSPSQDNNRGRKIFTSDNHTLPILSSPVPSVLIPTESTNSSSPAYPNSPINDINDAITRQPNDIIPLSSLSPPPSFPSSTYFNSSSPFILSTDPFFSAYTSRNTQWNHQRIANAYMHNSRSLPRTSPTISSTNSIVNSPSLPTIPSPNTSETLPTTNPSNTRYHTASPNNSNEPGKPQESKSVRPEAWSPVKQSKPRPHFKLHEDNNGTGLHSPNLSTSNTDLNNTPKNNVVQQRSASSPPAISSTETNIINSSSTKVREDDTVPAETIPVSNIAPFSSMVSSKVNDVNPPPLPPLTEHHSMEIASIPKRRSLSKVSNPKIEMTKVPSSIVSVNSPMENFTTPVAPKDSTNNFSGPLSSPAALIKSPDIGQREKPNKPNRPHIAAEAPQLSSTNINAPITDLSIPESGNMDLFTPFHSSSLHHFGKDHNPFSKENIDKPYPKVESNSSPPSLLSHPLEDDSVNQTYVPHRLGSEKHQRTHTGLETKNQSINPSHHDHPQRKHVNSLIDIPHDVVHLNPTEVVTDLSSAQNVEKSIPVVVVEEQPSPEESIPVVVVEAQPSPEESSTNLTPEEPTDFYPTFSIMEVAPLPEQLSDSSDEEPSKLPIVEAGDDNDTIDLPSFSIPVFLARPEPALPPVPPAKLQPLPSVESLIPLINQRTGNSRQPSPAPGKSTNSSKAASRQPSPYPLTGTKIVPSVKMEETELEPAIISVNESHPKEIVETAPPVNPHIFAFLPSSPPPKSKPSNPAARKHWNMIRDIVPDVAAAAKVGFIFGGNSIEDTNNVPQEETNSHKNDDNSDVQLEDNYDNNMDNNKVTDAAPIILSPNESLPVPVISTIATPVQEPKRVSHTTPTISSPDINPYSFTVHISQLDYNSIQKHPQKRNHLQGALISDAATISSRRPDSISITKLSSGSVNVDFILYPLETDENESNLIKDGKHIKEVLERWNPRVIHERDTCSALHAFAHLYPEVVESMTTSLPIIEENTTKEVIPIIENENIIDSSIPSLPDDSTLIYNETISSYPSSVENNNPPVDNSFSLSDEPVLQPLFTPEEIEKASSDASMMGEILPTESNETNYTNESFCSINEPAEGDGNHMEIYNDFNNETIVDVSANQNEYLPTPFPTNIKIVDNPKIEESTVFSVGVINKNLLISNLLNKESNSSIGPLSSTEQSNYDDGENEYMALTSLFSIGDVDEIQMRKSISPSLSAPPIDDFVLMDSDKSNDSGIHNQEETEGTMEEFVIHVEFPQVVSEPNEMNSPIVDEDQANTISNKNEYSFEVIESEDLFTYHIDNEVVSSPSDASQEQENIDEQVSSPSKVPDINIIDHNVDEQEEVSPSTISSNLETDSNSLPNTKEEIDDNTFDISVEKSEEEKFPILPSKNEIIPTINVPNLQDESVDEANNDIVLGQASIIEVPQSSSESSSQSSHRTRRRHIPIVKGTGLKYDDDSYPKATSSHNNNTSPRSPTTKEIRDEFGFIIIEVDEDVWGEDIWLADYDTDSD